MCISWVLAGSKRIPALIMRSSRFDWFHSCVPVPFRREHKECLFCGLLLCCMDEAEHCFQQAEYDQVGGRNQVRKSRKKADDAYALVEDNNNYLERALEIEEFGAIASSLANRHLSKSASELSSPREMPEARPRSAAPPEHSHISVYQKAHTFFAQLKTRLGHSKRERRHKSPGRQESSDYAADLSSEHSTPSTASPRHRACNRTGKRFFPTKFVKNSPHFHFYLTEQRTDSYDTRWSKSARFALDFPPLREIGSCRETPRFFIALYITQT
ncbi:uncharacterized protein LOC125504972 [Dendroctonus ponderosae]|uniref:uncharacterized protein LOC125504972 n=1 Tax=Dendroctonus ponderosae TaxID=77166 RepID=UPI002034C082|nr:uncharacterized protein LOC125504972 [Dendroctonus ponderosae]